MDINSASIDPDNNSNPSLWSPVLHKRVALALVDYQFVLKDSLLTVLSTSPKNDLLNTVDNNTNIAIIVPLWAVQIVTEDLTTPNPFLNNTLSLPPLGPLSPSAGSTSSANSNQLVNNGLILQGTNTGISDSAAGPIRVKKTTTWDKKYDVERKRKGTRGHGINLLWDQRAKCVTPYPENLDRLLKLLLNYKPDSVPKTEAGVASFTESAHSIAKSSLESCNKKSWRVWLPNDVFGRFSLLKAVCAPHGTTNIEFAQMLIQLGELHADGLVEVTGYLDYQSSPDTSGLMLNQPFTVSHQPIPTIKNEDFSEDQFVFNPNYSPTSSSQNSLYPTNQLNHASSSSKNQFPLSPTPSNQSFISNNSNQQQNLSFPAFGSTNSEPRLSPSPLLNPLSLSPFPNPQFNFQQQPQAFDPQMFDASPSIITYTQQTSPFLPYGDPSKPLFDESVVITMNGVTRSIPASQLQAALSFVQQNQNPALPSVATDSELEQMLAIMDNGGVRENVFLTGGVDDVAQNALIDIKKRNGSDLDLVTGSLEDLTLQNSSNLENSSYLERSGGLTREISISSPTTAVSSPLKGVSIKISSSSNAVSTIIPVSVSSSAASAAAALLSMKKGSKEWIDAKIDAKLKKLEDKVEIVSKKLSEKTSDEEVKSYRELKKLEKAKAELEQTHSIMSAIKGLTGMFCSGSESSLPVSRDVDDQDVEDSDDSEGCGVKVRGSWGRGYRGSIGRGVHCAGRNRHDNQGSDQHRHQSQHQHFGGSQLPPQPSQQSSGFPFTNLLQNIFGGIVSNNTPSVQEQLAHLQQQQHRSRSVLPLPHIPTTTTQNLSNLPPAYDSIHEPEQTRAVFTSSFETGVRECDTGKEVVQPPPPNVRAPPVFVEKKKSAGDLGEKETLRVRYLTESPEESFAKWWETTKDLKSLRELFSLNYKPHHPPPLTILLSVYMTSKLPVTDYHAELLAEAISVLVSDHSIVPAQVWAVVLEIVNGEGDIPVCLSSLLKVLVVKGVIPMKDVFELVGSMDGGEEEWEEEEGVDDEMVLDGYFKEKEVSMNMLVHSQSCSESLASSTDDLVEGVDGESNESFLHLKIGSKDFFL